MVFTEADVRELIAVLTLACAEPVIHDSIDDAMAYQPPDWRKRGRQILLRIAADEAKVRT